MNISYHEKELDSSEKMT